MNDHETTGVKSPHDDDAPTTSHQRVLTDGGRDPLDDYSDEELGQLVRGTAAFRAAAACAEFAAGARELRENDTLAFQRLIRETHDRQGTSVTKRATTETIVETFLDVVEDHAELADHPEDAVEHAATELNDGGDDA